MGERKPFAMRMYTLRKITALTVGLALALALLLGLLVMLDNKPASADLQAGASSEEGVQPTVIEDDTGTTIKNPTCADVGNYLPSDDSLKFDPPVAGTKTSTDGYLTATVDSVYTDTYKGFTGQFFDWHSDRDVDVVIAKGADGGDSYAYDLTMVPGPTRSDGHLHAPINASGSYANLSHMDFCYKVRPDVSKTADTTFTKTYKWTIAKSAKPTDLDLVTGQSGNSGYTVTVTKDGGTDSDWAVNGSITVTNPLKSGSIQVTSIDDAVSQGNSNKDVALGSCDPALPATLGPGDKLTCSYSTPLGSGTNGTNTATAHVSSSGSIPLADGVGTAPVTFGAPTTTINDSITVNDDFGTPGDATDDKSFSFDASGSQQYPKPIGPYDKCGDQTVTNTATMSPASAASGASSASATVTAHVKCKLTVNKVVDPATDTGKFKLLIDGVAKATDVGNGGSTGAQQVTLGDHTVSETAGTGTTLSNYVSKINCGGGDVSGTSTTVKFVAGDSDKTCTITNTRKAKAKVVKTVSGQPPSGAQAFTFQLRQGATTTDNGTTLDTQIANASNGGVINFASNLVPGDTYQLCEIVMPGWSTSLGTFVPDSFLPPDGVATNPNVDNSILCVNFKPTPGQTSTFTVNNTPPPGGRALTIGFWKNWASCANSGGSQKPVLDQTLAKAEATEVGAPGVVISAQSGTYPTFAPTIYLVLHGSTSTPNKAPDCQSAVRLLNKSTVGGKGTKMASDPAFNLAAQLMAAELNYAAGAGRTPTATTAINQAVVLLGKYKFDGNTHTTISAADATTMNNLARTLDDYNNDR
jgi:hypothetical protein